MTNTTNRPKQVKWLAILMALTILIISCSDDDEITIPPEVTTTELLGDLATPEGITIDQRNGDIYTGSVLAPSIQKTSGGVSEYLVNIGTSIFLPNVLGMTVDETNNRLWVCSTDFFGNPQSRISILDLANGNELASFDNSEMNTSADFFPFFNDVILDAAGNGYVSNSATNAIIKVESDLSSASVFTSNFPIPPSGSSYSLNGIDITRDGKYLIVPTFISSAESLVELFRIDITTGEVTFVDWTENGTTLFSTFGGDGVAFVNNNTMLSVGPDAILAVEFNSDYSEATIRDITTGTEAESEIMGCATVAVYDNNIYTTNAQIATIVNGGTPITPFYVAKIPFEIVGL